MKELIQIQTSVIGTEEVNSVNAREIYEYLGIKTHFSTWMQRCIEKYGFEENVDFQLFKSEKSKSNNPTKEYIVTLDMAKELCMITDTPKGKEVRKYFIEVEKEYRQQQKQNINDPQIAALVKALTELDSMKEQVKKIDVIEEKLDNMTLNKTILPKSGYASISSIAKEVGLSVNVTKKIVLQYVQPEHVEAVKMLDDGSAKPYFAYKVKPVVKFVKKMRKSAYPIGDKRVFFRSPHVDFKWQNV